MPLMVNEGNAIESIIPFDNPKHPKLPSNRFPSSGKAGVVMQAARVAWITGKYLYKFRKKWLAAGMALSTTSLFQGKPSENGGTVQQVTSSGKFSKTHPGQFRSAKRGRVKQQCPCRCCSKRRLRHFQAR